MEKENLINSEDVRSNLDNFQRSAERLKILVDRNAAAANRKCIACTMCMCFPCILCSTFIESFYTKPAK